MQTNSTTSARLADTDWSRFVREAEAMAIVIKAQTPYLSAREIGMVAAEQVEARYAAECAAQAETPTVYPVANILDALVIAVDAARQATTNRRWLTAIDAGFNFLLQQEIVEIDAHNALVYRSESGTYHANGTCQCVAFAQGQPCKHRAAARLVVNALHA